MKDADKVGESFEKAMKRILARMPPEQRLAGMPPEQRLAGLTKAQAVLALPDEMLRALSHEYIATLPPETRAAIQSQKNRRCERACQMEAGAAGRGGTGRAPSYATNPLIEDQGYGRRTRKSRGGGGRIWGGDGVAAPDADGAARTSGARHRDRRR